MVTGYNSSGIRNDVSNRTGGFGNPNPLFDISFGLGSLPFPVRIPDNPLAPVIGAGEGITPILPYDLNFGGGGNGTFNNTTYGGGVVGGDSGGGSDGTPWTDKAKLGLAGLQTLGGLWSAFEQRNLAKKAFNYSKKVTDTNLSNQIQSYNTALDDRIASRGKMQGMSQGEIDAYRNQNRLPKYGS